MAMHMFRQSVLVSAIAVLYPWFGDAATSIQSARSVQGNGSVERKGTMTVVHAETHIAYTHTT